jgi:hypothetical protein
LGWGILTWPQVEHFGWPSGFFKIHSNISIFRLSFSSKKLDRVNIISSLFWVEWLNFFELKKHQVTVVGFVHGHAPIGQPIS